MSKFPSCFPDDFETRILPEGAKKENKSVYRVIKSGKINRDSFLSTYEEIKKGLMPPKKRLDLNAPETYSTSCFEQYSDAEFFLNLFMRHYPEPFIASGITEGSCGPSQLTSERKEESCSHVDWWIYDDSQPQLYFKEVK